MNEHAVRKMSRRELLRLAGMSIAGVAAAACAAPAAPAATPAGGDTGAPEATAAPAAASAVTLRWYANADPARNKWMDEWAVPEFKKLHPEYTIEPIIVPWDEFDPKLTAMFAAKDLPEVFANWGSTGYAEYSLRGMCIFVDDYISASAAELALDDIAPSAVEGVKVRGKLVGLPMYILGTNTFYNKDLFEQEGLAFPPSDWDDQSWTWNKMLDTAQKLTKNYDDPAAGQYGLVYGWSSPEELPWLWDFEIWPEGTIESGVAREILFDNPTVIEAFQAHADLVCKHRVSPDSAISAALGASGNPFQAGKIAMQVDGAWVFGGLTTAPENFRWGVAALPRAKPNVMKDALYADPMLISSQTPLKDAAWNFVKFLYSTDSMRAYSQMTWWPPSRKSVLTDWTNMWPDDVRAELLAAVEGSWKYGETTPWNRIAGYSQFYDPIGAALDPVRLCEKTVAEVAPDLQKKVNEILAGLKLEGA